MQKYKLLKLIPDKTYIKIKYYIVFHKKIDLKNPKTFNEKINWLKLFDRKKEYIKMVDKYEVKNYVSKVIGEEHIIPTIGVYDRFEEINFEKLPNKFVIKCTHDSGGAILCKNKKFFDANEAKKKINFNLKNDYYYHAREWPYKYVKPRIIIEEYMEDKKNKKIVDYKFFCFNGKANYCLVCSDREENLKETFFDFKWNLAPFKRKNHDIDNTLKKPDNLDLMINLAQKLSKKVPFIRVDFYEVNGNVYFGELTFYPASGLSKFEPEEWDLNLGNMIELPTDRKIERKI